MLEKIKKRKIFLIILLTLSTIILITSQILTKKELLIDNIAYKILVKNLRDPNLTTIMKIITELSNVPMLIIITISLLLMIKNKKIALTIPINISLIAIINQILKTIFKRPRPTGYRLLKISGYSFPSGHAMASTAFYGLLIYLSYKYIKNKKIKLLSIILNIIVIISIGVSRIYLGVHYCSDVLVGQSVSIIYLIIYIKTLKKNQVLT